MEEYGILEIILIIISIPCYIFALIFTWRILYAIYAFIYDLSLIRDAELYGLRFYDGICKVERGSYDEYKIKDSKGEITIVSRKHLYEKIKRRYRGDYNRNMFSLPSLSNSYWKVNYPQGKYNRIYKD